MCTNDVFYKSDCTIILKSSHTKLQKVRETSIICRKFYCAQLKENELFCAGKDIDRTFRSAANYNGNELPKERFQGLQNLTESALKLAMPRGDGIHCWDTVYYPTNLVMYNVIRNSFSKFMCTVIMIYYINMIIY